MRLLPFDYAARNAGRNVLRTLLTGLGAAAVVFLVILMASFVTALNSTMRTTGDPLNAIVLGTGSENYLEQSEIDAAISSELAAGVDTIAVQPGSDLPMISPEVHHTTVATVPGATTEAETRAITVRGVTTMAYAVHSQVFVTKGRVPKSGELLVGRLAATKLGVSSDALLPGKVVSFDGREWTIGGVFSAPGTAFESEIWAPLEELKTATKRTSLTCAVVRLTNPEDFDDLEVFAKTRLDLEITTLPEVAYYGALANFFRPVQLMVWVMACLIVASGLFGGLNTMLAAIASRAREFACLETIGYGPGAIVVALTLEVLLVVGTGALLASVAAVLLLDGMAVRVSMGALALQVNGPVLLSGLTAALVLALIAPLLSSIRLMRQPLVEMLRG